jgi:hypothetical protein
MPAQLMRRTFNFYGLTIAVNSVAEDLVEEVRRHYAYFSKELGEVTVNIELRPMPPPYRELPSLPAAFFTPRNVCFKNGTVSYLDYFGEGLAVYDRTQQNCVVYGTKHDLLHEIAYLFILSTVGQYLDSQHMHRLHALGVTYVGRAVLLLLPSGGGKSTMALELMRQPGFMLLGEDTPLINRRGQVLPFPLRVGVRPEQNPDIPAEYLRTVERMEFDPKTLIDIDYFKGRIAGPADPGFILVGERNLGEVSEIVPLSRPKALKALLKYMIVGLGVYQGLEFLLERGIGDLLGKGTVVGSRLYNSLVLLSRAPAYRFVLGRNKSRNTQTLIDFLSRQTATKHA